MGDLLSQTRRKLIASALSTPVLDPAEADLIPILCGKRQVLLRTPSQEMLLREHVREADRIAQLDGGDNYDDIMQSECTRLMGERPTFWGELWPGAVVLGGLLLDEPTLVSARTVLEVGAGLGLAGICAALAGAASVVATDYEELSLHFTARNAAENGVGGRVQTQLLDWTEPTSDDLLTSVA